MKEKRGGGAGRAGHCTASLWLQLAPDPARTGPDHGIDAPSRRRDPPLPMFRNRRRDRVTPVAAAARPKPPPDNSDRFDFSGPETAATPAAGRVPYPLTRTGTPPRRPHALPLRAIYICDHA